MKFLSWRDSCTPHSCIIHNSQDMETTWVHRPLDCRSKIPGQRAESVGPAFRFIALPCSTVGELTWRPLKLTVFHQSMPEVILAQKRVLGQRGRGVTHITQTLPVEVHPSLPPRPTSQFVPVLPVSFLFQLKKKMLQRVHVNCWKVRKTQKYPVF